MHWHLHQGAPEQEIVAATKMEKDQKAFILASQLQAKLTELREKPTDKQGENQRASVLF